jgi:hypothetical protein
MFDFSPEGQALAVRHNLMIFKCSKPFKLGQSSKVKVQLPPQSGKPITLPIQILEDLGLEQSSHIYQALVLVELQGFEYLPANSLTGHAVRIRVRSPELPNFQAMALEFTPRSTLLELSAKVAPGTPCVLSFDLEGYSSGSFSCQASSVFCLPAGNKCFGQFRFDPADAQAVSELAEVFQFLGQRANSSLESLLESAKIVPQGALLPASHTPAKEAAAPAKAEDLLLPVNSTMMGYYRNLENQSVIFRFNEPGQASAQELEFPQCHSLWDEETARCQLVANLRSLRTSPKLEQMQARLGPGDWRHYQFLSEDTVVLLELVSRPCRPFLTA